MWRQILGGLCVGLALAAPARAENFWNLPGAAVREFVASGQIVIKRVKPTGNTLDSFDIYCRCPVILTAHEIPVFMAQAIVAIEDERYFDRKGSAVDLGAMANVVLSFFRGKPRGGSTIPMQLLKNVSLYEVDGKHRKLTEWLNSGKLLEALGENEQLAAYLNQITFAGREVVGVYRASRHYFGVEPARLTLFQSAVLAATVQSPGRMDWVSPLRRSSPNAAETSRRRKKHAFARALLVIEKMQKKGFITEKQAAAAKLDHARELRSNRIPDAVTEFTVEHRAYMQWAAKQFIAAHPDQLPKDVKKSARIVTSLEPFTQRIIERHVKDYLREAAVPDNYEIAVVAMDLEGRVRSLVGGRDWSRSQFDIATLGQRQVGSVAKLATVAAACEADPKWTSKTRVVDEPNDSGWPRNADDRYHGQTNMRDAFAHSWNAALVRVAEKATLPKVVDMGGKLGMYSAPAGGAAPTFDWVLGSWSASPMAMTAAYGAIAGGRGAPFAPTGVLGAVSGEGEAVRFDRRPQPAVLSSRCVDSIRVLLRAAVTEGTGAPADTSASPTYGKTGTTTSGADVWFIGWSGEHLIGVWLGRPYGAEGPQLTSRIPASLFGLIARSLNDRDNRHEKVRSVDVAWNGGKPAMAAPDKSGGSTIVAKNPPSAPAVAARKGKPAKVAKKKPKVVAGR